MDAAAYIAEACRWFVLITLSFAAWSKSIGFARFSRSLADSFEIPDSASKYAAVAIVSSEWAVAALIVGRGIVGAAGMAAALILLLMFTAVITAAIVQNRPISCNCFGRTSQPISAHDLIRNGLLMGACGFNLLYASQARSIDVTASLLLAGIGFISFVIATNLRDIDLALRAKTDAME